MNVYLGLGTNQGNKYKNIQNAVNAISLECGEFISKSSIYESPPWGFKTEESFYNSVVHIKTELLPEELLYSCKKIEVALGRKKKTKLSYESRIIDIDILLYDNINLDLKDLKIPHPLMFQNPHSSTLRLNKDSRMSCGQNLEFPWSFEQAVK